MRNITVNFADLIIILWENTNNAATALISISLEYY